MVNSRQEDSPPDPAEPEIKSRTLRGLLRSWYSLTASEQKALLFVLALLFLGILVRCVLRGFMQ